MSCPKAKKRTRMARLNRRQNRFGKQSLPRQNQPSVPTSPSDDRKVNVVFEYNELAGHGYEGGRFFSCYQLSEIEKLRLSCNNPDSKTKIVAVDISDAEAQKMCHASLLNGVGEQRIKSIATDPDIPYQMKRMQMMTILFAAQFGGRNVDID